MLWRVHLCAVALALSATGAVQASEYDSYTCSDLWLARNQIYKEAGLCFKTAAAIRTFGNAGCQFDDAEGVPLTSDQQGDIDDIVAVERRKGCH